MKFSIIAMIYFTFSTAVTFAAPPEGADPALAPWYQSLKVPHNDTSASGLPCCSLADCRPVRYRTAGDHFEAFLTAKTFPERRAPDGWVSVPDEVVIKQKENPTGEGVLCFYAGEIRCFVPANGT